MSLDLEWTGSIPVSKRSNDKTWCVSEVLVAVLELSITDVCVTMFISIIPAMSQLREPCEGLSILNLHVGKMSLCNIK